MHQQKITAALLEAKLLSAINFNARPARIRNPPLKNMTSLKIPQVSGTITASPRAENHRVLKETWADGLTRHSNPPYPARLWPPKTTQISAYPTQQLVSTSHTLSSSFLSFSLITILGICQSTRNSPTDPVYAHTPPSQTLIPSQSP